MKIDVTGETITVIEADRPITILGSKPALKTLTSTEDFASSFENCIILGTSILNQWGEI